MTKRAIAVSAALLLVGSVGTADAQRWRGGWGHGGFYGYRDYRGGWGGGGALAAGLVGGAILGGLITAAATPAYGYDEALGAQAPTTPKRLGRPLIRMCAAGRLRNA